MDIGELIGRLRGASAKLLLGRVDHAGMSYTARAMGAFDSLGAVRAIPGQRPGPEALAHC